MSEVELKGSNGTEPELPFNESERGAMLANAAI